MLIQKDYFKFAMRAHKIIKKCFLGNERPSQLDTEEYYFLRGFSPYTKDISYYYSIKDAIDSQNDLLDILKRLPKTDIWGGPAILYTDLLSDTKDPQILKSQLTLADQFSHLLVVSDLGYRASLENNNKKSSFVNVEILPFFEALIMSDNKEDEFKRSSSEPEGRDSH